MKIIQNISKLNKKIIPITFISSITALCLVVYFSSILAFEMGENFPLTINDVQIFGEDRVEKTNFSENEVILFVTNVERPLKYFMMGDDNQTDPSTGDTNIRLILTIMDDIRRPVFINIINSSISIGEDLDITTSFLLPYEAYSSTYIVSVMVWDDLGTPLSEEIGETVFYVS